jgi:uncharacterized protein YbaR (Trm112 family)
VILDDTLLGILVCPIDKQSLLYFADQDLLYNPRLRRVYHVSEGIPLMLARDAEPVVDLEHERLMKCARAGEAIVTSGAGTR